MDAYYTEKYTSKRKCPGQAPLHTSVAGKRIRSAKTEGQQSNHPKLNIKILSFF
jgi:hypothetical protein